MRKRWPQSPHGERAENGNRRSPAIDSTRRFLFPAQNLVIEIDRPCHDSEKDFRRDEWFARERGIRILRFTNEQVLSGVFRLRVS